jgi:hypothetical protein
MKVFHIQTVSAPVRRLFETAPPQTLTPTRIIHAQAEDGFYTATLHDDEVRFFRSDTRPLLNGEPGSLGTPLDAEPQGVTWDMVSGRR